jgi:hypothetical protein
MSDDRAVKKVFVGKPYGRRKAGRPKLRWLDCIENDLKSMGVKRWREKAEDICMWYRCEGGTGYTVRTVCQRRRRRRKGKGMLTRSLCSYVCSF